MKKKNVKNKKAFTYRFLRRLVLLFYRKREFIGLNNIPNQPSIIVGNHAQIHGPLVAELFFPKKRLTWCIGQVQNKKEFPEYAMQDFWQHKPKRSKWFYKILAHGIAPISQTVFTNADVIPVYKDARILSTFKQTLKGLENENHIIIFPEKAEEYNSIVNEFQTKFIDIAKLYYAKHGKCLSFVPMYNAVRLKKVIIGKPIAYDPNLSLEEQREKIAKYLQEEITRLAVELPRHKVVQYVNNGKRKNPYSK